MTDVNQIKLPNGSTYSFKDDSAVANITRSGTTFTATKRDGTTFTFTQQDNNTTYTLGTSGNDVTLTPAGSTAQSITVPYATLSNTVNGVYTYNGGKQNPDYFGKNRVGFLMSNATVSGDSHYKNWLYMDCYSANDAGGATAIGVDRSEPRAFIMQSDANRTAWNNTAALGVFTATPTTDQVVTTDGTTGGIKSSGYTIAKSVPSDAVFTDTNTTYTFTGGTNKFTVTPSGGTAQDITITPSITNNITGSGTTNYVPKFTGTNTIGNGWGTTTSVTSGSGSLVTSGGVWSALASRTVMRDPFVHSGTSYNVDDIRGATRFVYTTHGAPNTGTIVAFDSSDNTNYTLQLLGGYSTDRLFFRTRYGDKSTWNAWLEANPRYQYATIQSGSSATYYIPLGMRGTNGSESQYLLSCPQANGGGGLFLLCPDTYSTQKMIITTLRAFSGTVSQTIDPWGFIIRTGGSATVPSVIRL